jgi:hypothetical protein
MYLGNHGQAAAGGRHLPVYLSEHPLARKSASRSSLDEQTPETLTSARLGL